MREGMALEGEVGKMMREAVAGQMSKA